MVGVDVVGVVDIVVVDVVVMDVVVMDVVVVEVVEVGKWRAGTGVAAVTMSGGARLQMSSACTPASTSRTIASATGSAAILGSRS